MSANDIPPSQDLDILTEQIEGIWIDIDTSTPDWLNQVTLDLVGQTRMDELNKERERLQSERKEAEEQERKQKEKEQKQKESEGIVAMQAFRLKLEAYAQERKKKQADLIAIQQQSRLAIEAKHQSNQESRALEIQKICEEYKIKTLIHFTHISNLHSILHNGLRGRIELGSMSEIQAPHYNDSLRLDRYPQATCLSISFPNYQMFYKYRCKNPPDSNWVILFIKPSVLWKLNCKFFFDNAASNNARESMSEKMSGARKDPKALRQMFADCRIQRQSLQIPISFTTNPQAEVLVFESISPEYIMDVLFGSLEIGEQWICEHPGKYLQEFNAGNKEYFEQRQDWQIWKSAFSS